MALRNRSKEETTTEVPTVTPPEQQQVTKREVDDLVLEVMRQKSVYSDDKLREGKTFEDFARMVSETMPDGVVDVADVLGDGFTVLSREQKSMLVGVPLVFMEWDFYEGKFGRPFVAVRVVAKLPGGATGKYIINDSGAGICEQLAKYTKETNVTRGLFARKGLTRSDYKTTDNDGNEIDGATYYIDTAAVA